MNTNYVGCDVVDVEKLAQTPYEVELLYGFQRWTERTASLTKARDALLKRIQENGFKVAREADRKRHGLITVTISPA